MARLSQSLAGAPDGTIGRGWPLRLLLFVALAMLAHVLLSRLGFNPTDDGFILAQSRRLLEGQIPHRDFISIRPVGSALLHTLDLALGGSRTFLVSRAIYWLEVALTCWCWSEISLLRNRASIALLGAVPLGATAFMFSTHGFPPMAWHTVDAVFLASVGFLVTHSARPGRRLLGYALVGAAAICKQNFLPVLPLAVLVNGESRRAAAWLAVVAPGLLYLVALSLLGAGPDMLQQLFALTTLRQSGITRYIAAPGWPSGLLAGAASGALLRAGAVDMHDRSWLRRGAPWLGFALLVALTIMAGRTIDAPSFAFIMSSCYAVMGALCGLTISWLGDASSAPVLPAALFLIGLAWSSGISLGYQTPAHVAGPMALLLGISSWRRVGGRWRGAIAALAAWGAMLAIAPHWWSERRDHIYNEATAPMLTRRLDGVLPGGAGLQTNPNTYAVLLDLKQAIAGLGGRRYTIVVDASGWWACAQPSNPLPSDWPQVIELCTTRLQERYSRRAAALRHHVVFVVQKVQMTTLADGIHPLDPGNLYYGAALWIRHTFTKTGGTRYWDVYE